MKKIILALFLTGSILTFTRAQNKSINRPPNKYSVVKDSSGKVYSPEVWQRLLLSHQYSLQVLKRPEPDSVEYVLKKLSEEEKSALMANIPRPPESEQFKLGDTFYAFKDRDINGVKLDTKKELAGKILVINFWFIDCPPCRAEIPDLNEIADQYKDNKDVVFIAFALDGRADLKEFLAKHPFNFHVVSDSRLLAAKYGVRFYPISVVVDRSGKVAYSCVSNYVGNPHWIKKTIDAALAAPVKTTAAQ